MQQKCNGCQTCPDSKALGLVFSSSIAAVGLAVAFFLIIFLDRWGWEVIVGFAGFVVSSGIVD